MDLQWGRNKGGAGGRHGDEHMCNMFFMDIMDGSCRGVGGRRSSGGVVGRRCHDDGGASVS